MEALRGELQAYYSQYRLANSWRCDEWEKLPAENRQLRTDIIAAMDAYAAEHPDYHPSLLKARLLEEMAERFVPVIFPHSPFFFEMGLRYAESWGTPSYPLYTPGAWLNHAHADLAFNLPEWAHVTAGQNIGQPPGAPHLWNIWSGFDTDHHCLGNTRLLRDGVNGLLRDIAARQALPCDAHQAANLEAMDRGCRAVLRVAEKFGDAARAMLEHETDPQAQHFLRMIADAAVHIPAEPPRTFYEGLAMLWFLREVTATLEAIGISVVGHLDRQLFELYRADLAAGRLTEEEACDLLARWMLPTDVKFHLEDNAWPETSTCIELGGCDAEGQVVWNALTRLIIETHHAQGLINPKLNCRFSAHAPQDYLDLLSDTILRGHNHLALLNDDVLIPACVRAGKTEQEARLYVNGGCQETIVEGMEHSAGAYYYFNMPRILDLCLQPYDPATSPLPLTPELAQGLPQPIPAVATFDEFYQRFMAAMQTTIRLGADWIRPLGQLQWQLHPCPFFSATLEDCIGTGLDYTQGGAKYNPSGIALCGLGTITDALYAVRQAVFEDRSISYEELCRALAADWQGYEALRQHLRRLSKFGQGHAGVDALAAQFARDLGAFIPTLPNERGGAFQGSFFVYYAFQWFGNHVRATPDGRHAGELLAQGIAPHRATAPESVTDILHSLSRIDFRAYPGNCVLDLQLPAGQAISPATLSAVFRTFAKLGGPTLQPNFVAIEHLRDAQAHPDQYPNLVVRISGLSAHFICLTRAVQDEIIERAVVAI